MSALAVPDTRRSTEHGLPKSIARRRVPAVTSYLDSNLSQAMCDTHGVGWVWTLHHQASNLRSNERRSLFALTFKERPLCCRKHKAASTAAASRSELTQPPSGMGNNHRRERTDNFEPTNTLGDGLGFALCGADSRQELAALLALCYQRKHSRSPEAPACPNREFVWKNVKFEVKSVFLIGEKTIILFCSQFCIAPHSIPP